MATQEQVQELFRLLDYNQDGKVSIQELYGAELFPLVMGITGGRPPEHLLENYDSDKDGSLTLEEFKKVVEGAATK
ncbi:EF-hand domain-containing protein [Nostoc sp. XA010]|uniref:EF-hand domain-containing protein n=1 Tax=Nostoc sp. XA010 TaxID=2780407 RepID=UPI001E3174AB|nr:EF-hand domain-containing protein [Nostoc sp. XA010]MCC5659217.1 EF-hand domain-containing protein [Nostoc sp. XA010]